MNTISRADRQRIIWNVHTLWALANADAVSDEFEPRGEDSDYNVHNVDIDADGEMEDQLAELVEAALAAFAEGDDAAAEPDVPAEPTTAAHLFTCATSHAGLCTATARKYVRDSDGQFAHTEGVKKAVEKAVKPRAPRKAATPKPAVPKAAMPVKKTVKAVVPKKAKATPDDAAKSFADVKAGQGDAGQLREQLQGLTVPQLNELAGTLGVGPLKGTKPAKIDTIAAAAIPAKSSEPAAPRTARNLLDEPGLPDRLVQQVKDDPNVKKRWGVWADNTGGDPMLTAIAKEQGFDEPMDVVDAKRFRELVRDGTISETLFRGVKDGGGGVTAAQVMEQFRSGKFRGGAGIFGNGTYMATDRSLARAYSNKTPGSVGKFGLRADARVVPYDEISAEHEKWFMEKFGGKYVSSPEYDAFVDLGRYAAARGFDAIFIPKSTEPGFGTPAEGDQYAILNRKALIGEAAK